LLPDPAEILPNHFLSFMATKGPLELQHGDVRKLNQHLPG